jgi:ribosomal protein S18 acetylase RimI-like enzyme
LATDAGSLVIRRAERRDAKLLSRLAERTFRETFGAANTPEDMALHCRAAYSEVIQAAEIESPDMASLLCEHAGRLVGFAQLRWGKAPGCVPGDAPGEVQRLYVASDYHGRGVAQALMTACLVEMRNRPSDVVWLGVWERNPRAMRFYDKFGFVEVGDHIFLMGNDPQRDIVMARGLPKAAPCD